MSDKMRDIVVYVAGPITRGGVRGNVERACAAGLRLLRAGLVPCVPHLGCYMGQVYYGEGCLPEVLPEDTTHQQFYESGLALVRRSDALLRLSGESVGSDAEVAEAKRCSIPVFDSVEAVLAWAARQEPPLV